MMRERKREAERGRDRKRQKERGKERKGGDSEEDIVRECGKESKIHRKRKEAKSRKRKREEAEKIKIYWNRVNVKSRI